MKPPIKDCKWAQYPYGDVTQFFAESPSLYASMGLSGHNGIDIVRPHGEHLFAVEDGTICAVKEDPGGYGKHIRMVSKEPDEKGYHRDWVYGHLSFIAVKNGQEVKAGQYIGNMGNTGFVVSGNTPYWESNPYAGTHCHFGVRPIKPVRGGFTYPGLPGTWSAVNYDNGYKGRIDPLPYFLDPKLPSTKILLKASTITDPVFFKLSRLLQILGL